MVSFRCSVFLQVIVILVQKKTVNMQLQTCNQTSLKENLSIIFTGEYRRIPPHEKPLECIVCISCRLNETEKCNTTSFVHKVNKAVQGACDADICKNAGSTCNKIKIHIPKMEKMCKRLKKIKNILYSNWLQLGIASTARDVNIVEESKEMMV